MSGILVITSCFPLYAQKIKENDEIFASVGVNVPMYKGVESDVVVGLHYGHYYLNGIGYRIGFNYSPSVADVSNYFGIPLAFTYRAGSRSFSNRVQSATVGAFNSAAGSGEEGLKCGFTAFLMNMFDRIEDSVGLLSSKDKSLRWFFTFSGGLAFRF